MDFGTFSLAPGESVTVTIRRELFESGDLAILNGRPLGIVAVGDVDGDRDIDLTDAVLAMQVGAGIEPAVVIFKEAGAAGHNRIGIETLVYIFQKLAGLR
jgi:hypothetical protein